jgi:hypothetical protein
MCGRVWSVSDGWVVWGGTGNGHEHGQNPVMIMSTAG